VLRAERGDLAGDLPDHAQPFRFRAGNKIIVSVAGQRRLGDNLPVQFHWAILLNWLRPGKLTCRRFATQSAFDSKAARSFVRHYTGRSGRKRVARLTTMIRLPSGKK